MQPVVETHERRDVEGRVVGRGFHHVVHAVEVAVPFRVYERDAACGVFAVFERLDTGDAVAVAPEAGNAHVAPLEFGVERRARTGADDLGILCQGVCVDHAAVLCDERFHAVARDAQADDALVRGGVIVPQSFDHAVEAVPEMDVRHGQQP